MKILEAFDKEVKGKKYYRYRINLPKRVVGDSKLKGKKLKARAEMEKIIIEKEKWDYVKDSLLSYSLTVWISIGKSTNK